MNKTRFMLGIMVLVGCTAPTITQSGNQGNNMSNSITGSTGSTISTSSSSAGTNSTSGPCLNLSFLSSPLPSGLPSLPPCPAPNGGGFYPPLFPVVLVVQVLLLRAAQLLIHPVVHNPVLLLPLFPLQQDLKSDPQVLEQGFKLKSNLSLSLPIMLTVGL